MKILNVKIKNCNSITNAEVQITPGVLNLKHGPNGLGKSTIARAIVSHIRADDTLQELVPFGNRGKLNVDGPKVEGVDDLKSALVFDETYVNQFVFQKDEVLKNSFEIFIRTPEYLKELAEIDSLLTGVKTAFADNEEIEQVIRDLSELREAFGKSVKGGAIHKNSKIYKAFGSGNKVENIPALLSSFETFIKSKEPAKWISWQVKGNEFLEIGDACPYCSSSLIEPEKKETARAVAKEYDAKEVEHLITLKAVIERLGKYFSEKCRKNLEMVMKSKIELAKMESAFLTALKTQIDALISILVELRAISFFSLRDVQEVSDKLTPLIVNFAFIDNLDSDETRKTVDPINLQLSELIDKIGHLQGKINRHKLQINNNISSHEKNINSFLRSAGYKYTVAIVDEADSYKMKLAHNDDVAHIETASRHLSYGEKNAFALVLFMHQVLSEKPDLVVLDDPISSFDKSKKFAILHELFTGKASLKGMTVLLFTHDIEPVIDVIKSTSSFASHKPSATFLSSRSGVLTEVQIRRDDLQTFTQICRANIEQLDDPLVKSIYLRRHFEVTDEKGIEYNLLASLFKGREAPTIRDAENEREMTLAERSAAEAKIREDIKEFDYDSLLAEVKDQTKIKSKFNATTIGYEKIQLFRILNGRLDDDVIRKFINESYHIENEYVMQLNPHKFEMIPEYIVKECERILGV